MQIVEKKADYVVAGVIRDVRANVCYANPKRNVATAEASLAIDWQVYSYRTRDVAFKATTEGSSLMLRPQVEPHRSHGRSQQVRFRQVSASIRVPARFLEHRQQPDRQLTSPFKSPIAPVPP